MLGLRVPIQPRVAGWRLDYRGFYSNEFLPQVDSNYTMAKARHYRCAKMDLIIEE